MIFEFGRTKISGIRVIIVISDSDEKKRSEIR